jgi:hypothetical protein
MGVCGSASTDGNLVAGVFVTSDPADAIHCADVASARALYTYFTSQKVPVVVGGAHCPGRELPFWPPEARLSNGGLVSPFSPVNGEDGPAEFANLCDFIDANPGKDITVFGLDHGSKTAFGFQRGFVAAARMAKILLDSMCANSFNTLTVLYDSCCGAEYAKNIYEWVRLHATAAVYAEFTRRVLLLGASSGLAYCLQYGGSHFIMMLLNVLENRTSTSMNMGALTLALRIGVEEGLYPNELPSAAAQAEPVSRFFGGPKAVFKVKLRGAWQQGRVCRSDVSRLDQTSVRYRSWFVDVAQKAGLNPDMKKYDRPSAPLNSSYHEAVQIAAMAKLDGMPGRCLIFFELLDEVADHCGDAAVLRAIAETVLDP